MWLTSGHTFLSVTLFIRPISQKCKTSTFMSCTKTVEYVHLTPLNWFKTMSKRWLLIGENDLLATLNTPINYSNIKQSVNMLVANARKWITCKRRTINPVKVTDTDCFDVDIKAAAVQLRKTLSCVVVRMTKQLKLMLKVAVSDARQETVSFFTSCLSFRLSQ